MKKLLPVIILGLASLPAAAQLDLPDSSGRKKKPASEAGPAHLGGDVDPMPPGYIEPDQPKASGDAAKPNAGTAAPNPMGSAAIAIFDHLRGLKNPTKQIVGDAALSLATMGASGLVAARIGLSDEASSVVMASARALHLGGLPLDASLVRARLNIKLPSRLLTDLLALELEMRSPTDGNQLLVELLNHKRSAMRKVAGKQYRSRISELDLPALFELTSSERSDSRALALELLSSFATPKIDQILLVGLGDSVSRVASKAVELLAKRIQGAKDPLLVSLLSEARLAGYADNRGANAMLAVIEAEDRLGLSLVPTSETVNLLIHMRKGEPFVAAVSAIALAGIGFRSEEHMGSLDLEVPHALVSSISGGVYFPEYTQIRPSAIRRLSQITGQFLGDDGGSWQAWWQSNAAQFTALRAVMNVQPTEHEALEVRWYSPSGGESFRLLGSLATDSDNTYAGQTLRLVPQKSSMLMQSLQQSKVFDASRLPGLIGVSTGLEDEFEVRVGEQAKLFRLGADANREWLQPVLSSLRDFREESVWQLYPGVRYGLTNEGRREFFQAESGFWSTEHTELERDRRLVNLMLDNVSLVQVEMRDSTIVEALRIYGKPGVPSEEDFPLLTNLLRDESFFGERARGILTLALRSGRAVALQSGEPLPLATDFAGELLDILVVGSERMRLEPLAMVLQASTPNFQWAAAADPRAGVRAVASSVLSLQKDETSMQLLHQLLSDPDVTVESATVHAVTTAGLAEFEDEILLRARVGDPYVRYAALAGLAHLKCDESYEILRLALMEQEPKLRQVAAASLASLADPRSATLLTSMFAAGPSSPLFESAHRGLTAMGEPAWNDLLGIARSRTNSSNREAAIILSSQGVVDVTSILITMLTDNPSDSTIANELVTLTGVNFMTEPVPSSAWWDWWDRTTSDNPVVWFCDALAAAELSMYGSSATLIGEGTIEGGLGLIVLLRGGTTATPHLVERARRELGRLLGRDIGKLPPRGPRHEAWCDDLESEIGTHYLQEAQDTKAEEELLPTEPSQSGE